MLCREKTRVRNRRGVTLLFVVSMIVLFLLMATTFVIVSNSFLRDAKRRGLTELHHVDGQAYLEQAFYDLIREPDLNNRQSPLRGHSLLGDMYGYGFTANVANAGPHPSQHFISLQLDFAGTGQTILDGSKFEPEPVSAMAGLVLSFVDGPAKGMSTRIVDHLVSGDASAGYQHTFLVLLEWHDQGFSVEDAGSLAGSRVVVNGRPFSGTGAGGFDPLVSLDQPALGETALQPNQQGQSRAAIVSGSGGYLSRGNSGIGYSAHSASTNEQYDTFDEQNLFLAGILPDGSPLKPSFHRPELIQRSGTGSAADFRVFPKSGAHANGVEVDNDNNGIPESIWMDIGLPIQSFDDGTLIQPLVSYTVVDLDGRLNLNAHGSLQTSDRQMTELDLLGQPSADELHRGQGYGPPEISVTPLLAGASASIVGRRYGADGKPGQADVRDEWSAYKLYGYPNRPLSDATPGSVGRFFGSAMDLHGRFAIGYPHDLRDLNDAEFPIGLPVANVATSSLPTEAVDSAYEMGFGSNATRGAGGDDPYSARDLEGVLRQTDADSSMLSTRLIDAGQGIFSLSDRTHSVTTSSIEVPTTVENLPSRLALILRASGLNEVTMRNQLRLLLPPEVRCGLPMNVNRPFGDAADNNGNDVVDESSEVGAIKHPSGGVYGVDLNNDGTVGGAAEHLARADFARHLYVLTLLATEQVDRNGDGVISDSDWFDFNNDGTTDNSDRMEYRKRIAQWAVNVVDYRDRDAICTPFEVDLNPWNGWGVDGDPRLSSSESSLGDTRIVVWGAERPELLISETLAAHDRRTQNLDIDASGEMVDPDGDDEDFDSHLVPLASVFFELYNPWVQNDVNQFRPPEFYDAGLNGVDLQKKSRDGSTPVWRLMVTGHDEQDLDPDDPDSNEVAGGVPRKLTTVRRIYFTRPDSGVDTGPEVYYPDTSISVDPVPPGVYAVAGSAGIKDGDEYSTYLGRRATADALDELDQTRRIVMNPTAGTLEVGFWNFTDSKMDTESRSIVTIPIGMTDGNQPRNLGVSDPLDGYQNLTGEGMPIQMTEIEDGHKFTEDTTAPDTDYAFDEPVDKKIDPDHYQDYLQNDGLKPAYRTVHLQRLANPLLAFDADTNPYLTIDSSSVDLFVFNGVEPFDDPNNQPDLMRFGTFERRSATDDAGNPQPNGQDESLGRQRLLFKNDRLGHQTPNVADSPTTAGDEHIFAYNLVETLGGLNKAWKDAANTGQKPFAWLMWNNRPFASQLELANVPFTSSYWTTRMFDRADENRNVYGPPISPDAETGAGHYAGHYPHLLNFYADQLESGASAASLHRLFDWLEVPSRFVGTESYVNPATFSDNRFGMNFGLAPPFDTISNYRYPGKLNINTVLDARVWNGLMQRYALAGDGVDFATWERSRNGDATGLDFANPYRSPVAANRVPMGSGKEVSPVECGLFRSTPGGSDKPLFDYDPVAKKDYNDPQRAAYFRYDMRQRLGNLVTSRSSVFAVWISVGYFEVDPDGELKTVTNGSGGVAGVELGSDTGEVQRHRSFYIVDRSIPVAFEPGRNHNVDRMVLVNSRVD